MRRRPAITRDGCSIMPIRFWRIPSSTMRTIGKRNARRVLRRIDQILRSIAMKQHRGAEDIRCMVALMRHAVESSTQNWSNSKANDIRKLIRSDHVMISAVAKPGSSLSTRTSRRSRIVLSGRTGAMNARSAPEPNSPKRKHWPSTTGIHSARGMP